MVVSVNYFVLLVRIYRIRYVLRLLRERIGGVLRVS